jgi:hypothetical protein
MYIWHMPGVTDVYARLAFCLDQQLTDAKGVHDALDLTSSPCLVVLVDLLGNVREDRAAVRGLCLG